MAVQRDAQLRCQLAGLRILAVCALRLAAAPETVAICPSHQLKLSTTATAIDTRAPA